MREGESHLSSAATRSKLCARGDDSDHCTVESTNCQAAKLEPAPRRRFLITKICSFSAACGESEKPGANHCGIRSDINRGIVTYIASCVVRVAKPVLKTERTAAVIHCLSYRPLAPRTSHASANSPKFSCARASVSHAAACETYTTRDGRWQKG